jgi:hypothetical protein
MTLYAGELTKIVHTATKDGEALLPGDVTGVSIILYDSTLEEVVGSSTMTWDSVKLRWQYLWDTSDMDAGTYRAKVTITGVDGGSVWEFKRIRLARNPV